ncbi:hypothetical protein [Nevskia sp.]|uniref:hypothetical protein n=1 Tax=Nevskia sp. TaxID=1929292 RepID=UPI003F707097
MVRDVSQGLVAALLFLPLVVLTPWPEPVLAGYGLWLLWPLISAWAGKPSRKSAAPGDARS